MRAAVDVPVMFHGHNNLGMAVANSIAAAEAGADILDACARGFGAGAGNTQLEVLVPVLERLGYRTGIDLYRLLDAADLAERELMPAPPTIDSVSIVSGLAGVFSGFKNRVLDISAREGVDPRDVFFELGRRQAVAGQEDLIVDVALALRGAQAEGSREGSESGPARRAVICGIGLLAAGPGSHQRGAVRAARHLGGLDPAAGPGSRLAAGSSRARRPPTSRSRRARPR